MNKGHDAGCFNNSKRFRSSKYFRKSRKMATCSICISPFSWRRFYFIILAKIESKERLFLFFFQDALQTHSLKNIFQILAKGHSHTQNSCWAKWRDGSPQLLWIFRENFPHNSIIVGQLLSIGRSNEHRVCANQLLHIPPSILFVHRFHALYRFPLSLWRVINWSKPAHQRSAKSRFDNLHWNHRH